MMALTVSNPCFRSSIQAQRGGDYIAYHVSTGRLSLRNQAHDYPVAPVIDDSVKVSRLEEATASRKKPQILTQGSKRNPTSWCTLREQACVRGARRGPHPELSSGTVCFPTAIITTSPRLPTTGCDTRPFLAVMHTSSLFTPKYPVTVLL